MEKKQSVLIVHNYYQLSGGEDTVVENEKMLLETYGHKVILYTRNNSELKNFNLFRKLLLPCSAIFSIQTYREVKRIIQKEKIDIVHVHNTLTLISPSVYYAAFSNKIPVVQTLHNFRMVCPGALLYRDGQICEECIGRGLKCSLKHDCYRNSKAQTLVSVLILGVHRLLGTYRRVNYICLTEFNKNKLLDGNGKRIFNERKMYIKPNFSLHSQEIIPYKDRKKQFVFVGRPEKVKGIDILLEAWRDIKDFQLIICGTSNEVDNIKKYICNNHIKNIILLGKVSNSKVKEILSESLALIMPTQWYEGFPMTIVESYSCGTPVLGSNIGNTGLLIRDGETGYRFQQDSSQDLCEKVYKLDDMTENCWRYYKENFDAETNYNRLLEIYNRIIT